MSELACDPKGLIREAYAIEGIGVAECRSIFVDWALSRPGHGAATADYRVLLAVYGAGAPDHPMTQILQAGLDAENFTPGRRRGGRAGRQN